jgi:hypothetical protein
MMETVQLVVIVLFALSLFILPYGFGYILPWWGRRARTIATWFVVGSAVVLLGSLPVNQTLVDWPLGLFLLSIGWRVRIAEEDRSRRFAWWAFRAYRRRLRTSEFVPTTRPDVSVEN